jgi:hypothetical protein
MNRNYSRDGLLKLYQQEATDHRDRKLIEKQARIQEERNALDNLNREIEQENNAKKNYKLQKMNERMEEYNKMLERKQSEKENIRNKRLEKKDTQGTFKIGSENREIRKKNYDDVSNNLILNPMRENARGRSEYESGILRHHPQRGSSHGFNIINHNLYQENSSIKTNYGRVNNISNTNYENGTRESEGNQIKTNNIQQQVEGIENLENYPYQEEALNRNNNELPPEYEDPEFQKYYEEYMRQKMREEEMAATMNKNESQIPTTMKDYEAYKSQMQKYPEEYPENNQNNVINSLMI